MSLDLDARQRAMLQEMGVQVWWPAPAQAAPERTATAPAPAAGAFAAQAPALPTPAARTPHPTAPIAPQADAAPARTVSPPAARTAPASSTGTGDAMATPSLWALGMPRSLFPQADPSHTPPDLGAGWLLVAEDTAGDDPFAGDAGLLLHNMLHALRLHRHPRIFLCALQVPGPADPTPATDTPPCAPALAAAIASVQPGVVLVMGRAAARAVLGRSEPLGQLRATPRTVAGVPAVVTYDASYLLRAPPATKAQAWADLCRARALATGGDTAAMA